MAYFQGNTLSATLALIIKAAVDKESALAAHRRFLADWTRRCGVPGQPFAGAHRWRLKEQGALLELFGIKADKHGLAEVIIEAGLLGW